MAAIYFARFISLTLVLTFAFVDTLSALPAANNLQNETEPKPKLLESCSYDGDCGAVERCDNGTCRYRELCVYKCPYTNQRCENLFCYWEAGYCKDFQNCEKDHVCIDGKCVDARDALGLAVGVIVAIVIGVILLITVPIVLICLCCSCCLCYRGR